MGEAKRRQAERTAAAAPEPRKLSEAELEQIHTETRRMDVRDRIAYWDKRQLALERVDSEGRVLTAADKVLRSRLNGEGVLVEELDWPEGSKLVPAATRILCPNDPKHGALQMSGSGSLLICQSRAPGDRNAFCSGSVPVSL